MAEAIDAKDKATRSWSLPAAGEHYVPLVDKTEDGYVYSHAIQTIQASATELYEYWTDVNAIPLWQEHVVSCTRLPSGLTHWVMGNPEDRDGKRVEFDSQLVADEPGRKLAWQSVNGDVEQRGSVIFAAHPSGRGTVVLLQESVKVPGGALGNAIVSTAKRGPGQTVIENLRHFKEMVETGEIPSVKGQPHGPRGITGHTKEWMYGETNPTPPGTSEAA